MPNYFYCVHFNSFLLAKSFHFKHYISKSAGRKPITFKDSLKEKAWNGFAMVGGARLRISLRCAFCCLGILSNKMKKAASLWYVRHAQQSISLTEEDELRENQKENKCHSARNNKSLLSFPFAAF
jgi:hypothetical protein